MSKYIKTFESFLNEGHLPFAIEKKIQLSGVSFEFDEERTEEDNDNRLDYVQIYVAYDRRNGVEWVIKTGIGSGFYYIEIQEDEEVVWDNKYPKSQKAYFDQDCVNSLGFIPEL
jgi:hypothetical protein